jgi:hypothetical protein
VALVHGADQELLGRRFAAVRDYAFAGRVRRTYYKGVDSGHTLHCENLALETILASVG